MPKHGRTKLVPLKTEPEKIQALETIEESNIPEQKEEPVIAELDNEIECPRCAGIMELNSSFDKLVYACESCSFLLSWYSQQISIQSTLVLYLCTSTLHLEP